MARTAMLLERESFIVQYLLQIVILLIGYLLLAFCFVSLPFVLEILPC
jgi:hypothetical protein